MAAKEIHDNRDYRIDCGWPRVMTAAIAATYCGEPSADVFRRKAKKIYAPAFTGSGRSARWLREDIDEGIKRNHHPVLTANLQPPDVFPFSSERSVSLNIDLPVSTKSRQVIDVH